GASGSMFRDSREASSISPGSEERHQPPEQADKNDGHRAPELPEPASKNDQRWQWQPRDGGHQQQKYPTGRTQRARTMREITELVNCAEDEAEHRPEDGRAQE